MTGPALLIVICSGMLALLGFLPAYSHVYNLNSIKFKTVGDGQHGAARFATRREIDKTYQAVHFQPWRWRSLGDQCSQTLKLPQGIILGCRTKRRLVLDKRKRFPLRFQKETYALVDTDDVHTLMVGAAGCGKTAYWLYPNLELACASGMSFMTTDTKGDLYRNYIPICKQYGYDTAVIDLRNPTRSDGNNA